MEKMPRHVEIDYSKYAPDIPEDQLEAYYGLPKHVQFCKECVMSNQKPNSCYEFEHTIKSIKKTHGHPGRRRLRRLPRLPQTRPTARSTGPCARGSCGSCATSYRKNGRQLRLPGARLRRQGQLLRRPSAEIQVRHAPADRHLGAAYLHPLGLGQLSGLDPCGLRQLPVHPQRHDPPPADPPCHREPVPPVPALHPGAEAAGAQDGRQVRHPAGVLRRERGRVRQPHCRQQLRPARRALLRRQRLRPYLPGRRQPAPAGGGL